MKFLNLFFAIYWIVLGTMCFTEVITLTPFSAGFICLVASTAFWNDLF